jgi:CDP-diacylglycerol--glycerol-3-phosphate 3-phosphatidyltransferase
VVGFPVWTLPNLLSLFRIAIIPLLVYLLTFSDPRTALLAASIFVLGSVSDFFDGYLARRRGSVSDLGRILDPLADKLMIISILIMLAAMERVGGEPEVPAWLVVLVVSRETAVTILRCIALTEGLVMEAEELGKYKFILQSFAVGALLVHYRYAGIDFYVAGMYFLVISTAVGLWSGVNYHVRFFRRFRRTTVARRPRN